MPGNGPGQAHQVRYDLRVFKVHEPSKLPRTFPAATEIIYERRGLVEPAHRLEEPLEPCRTYRWTVRARFVLNDAPRATEWTGAYDIIGDGPVAPWWWRRGGGAPLPSLLRAGVVAFYPIVETPSVDGTTCPGR